MAHYEYQVVPAPSKGVKAKGVKSPEARFALCLQDLMNEMGAEGWEYQRAETLPSVERSGLTSSTTNWRHVLVFRRALHDDSEQTTDLSEESSFEPQPVIAPAAAVATTGAALATDDPHPGGQPGATTMQADDGVEEISDVADVTTSLETLAQARKNPTESDV